MNTALCKTFIESKINESLILQEEMRSHDAEVWDPSCWTRTQKKKIRIEEQHSWIREIPSDMGMAPPADKSLVGCTVRLFLYDPCVTDCCVSIFTDAADEQIIAWSFQID
jgi:hypothetical protein